MAQTIKDALDIANVSDLPTRMQQVKIGTLIQGMIPTLNARTGLTSGAAQVHNRAARIMAVSTGGAVRTMVPAGDTPGATTVAVSYDAAGVPTLTFNAAVTAYTVQECVLPTALGTTLAENA